MILPSIMDQTKTSIKNTHKNYISNIYEQQMNFDEYDKIPSTRNTHRELVNRIHIRESNHQDNAYFLG